MGKVIDLNTRTSVRAKAGVELDEIHPDFIRFPPAKKSAVELEVPPALEFDGLPPEYEVPSIWVRMRRWLFGSA